MIEAIKLPGLRNGEFSQFILDFLDFVQKGNVTTLKVEAEFNNLKALSDKFEKNFKIPQGSAITDEIIAMDVRRDNAFTGMSFIVNGNTYSSNAEVKNAALLLSNHLAGYGKGIAADNFQSESASLRNIVLDFDTNPKLKAATELLGLVSWKDELTEANKIFIDTYRQRAEESGTASTDTLRDIRLEINPVYYELRDRLNAFFVIEKGAEPYSTVINKTNGIISFYNNLLSKRSGNNSNEEKPNDTPPTPPTE